MFTLPVGAVEGSQNTGAARSGDGSFEQDLEKAKTDLEKRSSPVIWDQLQSLFGILPLNFDFRSDAADTREKETAKEEAKPVNDNNTKHENARNSEIKNDDKIVFRSNDTKAIKEALIKLTPNSVVPPVIPMNISGTSQYSKIFSKAGMQLLIDEIVANAKLLKTRQRTELTLMMSQEDMGQINLSLSSRNGHVSVQISALAETKKQLQDSISELENALNMAHIDIEDIKIVEVSSEQLRSGG